MSLVFFNVFLFVGFPLILPCRFVCFTVVHVWFCFFARLYSPVWDLSWYNIFLRGMFIFLFCGQSVFAVVSFAACVACCLCS